MTRNPLANQQPTVPSHQVIPHQPYQPYHPVTPQQLISPPVTFTQDTPIDDAFTKLSAYVTDLIQNANFPSLQRACIEKAKSPKMLLKSNEIIRVIKEAQSCQELCFKLAANTTYWNFLDIRMMEAMAIASFIPAVQGIIKNFKETFYNMTLKEAAPCFPVMPVKRGYATMNEHLDKDPSQMTIFDLHKHRCFLEQEVVQDGLYTCTICKITIGSVKIVWQIHDDHVYLTHSRLKTMHVLLSSQAIRAISIPAMGQWEGLPFVFPGQDLSEIGPIQSTHCLRTEPYCLPQGFEWCVLNSSNFIEIIQLSKDTNSNPIAKNFLKWFISFPQYKKRYLSGIRLSASKKLVWILVCTPCNIRVEEKLLPMVNLQQIARICADTEKWLFQLAGGSIKETMRLLAFEGIFQAFMFMNDTIPKPVITYGVYFWDLHLQPLPYTSPRTVGLRRMNASDITKAFTLTNQYTSQFKIGQVFTSEEEFTHWFLSPLVDNIATYVVEVPGSDIITDMFSFKTFNLNCKVAEVIAMVITSSFAEQLITDLLVCAQQQNVTTVILPRFGLKKYLFKNFLKQIPLSTSYSTIKHQGHCLFYNYNYPEVDDDNHCLFGSRIHYGLDASRSS